MEAEDRIRAAEINVARLEAELRAVENATRLAKTEVDRRLGEMNELRAQIGSERAEFVDRQYYEQAHKTLELQVGSLDRRLAATEGASALRASTVAWALTALGLIITVVVVVVNLVLG